MPVGFLWTKLPLQPLHIRGIFSPAEVLLGLLEMSPAPDRTGPQVALWSCTRVAFLPTRQAPTDRRCRPLGPVRWSEFWLKLAENTVPAELL